MKLFFVIFFIVILLNSSYLVNSLSLRKRIGYIGGVWETLIPAKSDVKQITFPISVKSDLLEFRVDKDSLNNVGKDMYINITTINPTQYTYFNHYFSVELTADSTSDTTSKPSYAPFYYISCGSIKTYFSISQNNTNLNNGIKNPFQTQIMITISIVEANTMCKDAPPISLQIEEF